MKRIQKIGIYAVCFCLCVACSADSPFDDWGENGTNGGTNPGGSSGSSDASGTLLDFDVSWEDMADNSYVEIAETIITDKNDDEYDDFIENSSFASSIQIAYANGSATVAGSVSGVTVTTNGAHVTVNASVAGVEYVLSGSTSNGSFKVYSDKKFKLTLAGVSLTNDSGAAINIQSGKRVFVEVKTETENYLADASSYSTVTGEDEKGCFFSEGQLIFSGTGALTVTGNYKHGICSDDYVRLRSGSNITVASAVKDGIHTNDKIIIGGGILKVKASGDGLDCEKGFIDIRGGLIKADISGDASKAVKAETDITLSGGQLILLTSGSAVYEGNDLSSAAGIKCDGNLVMNGTTLSVKSTGAAGKGINCDGTLSIDNSTVKIITTGKQYVYNRLDSSAKGIKADGNLTINSGTIWVKTSGGEGSEGIESKSTLTVNGGDVSVYSYDDCMNASKSIVINGGNIYCYSSGNDGVDSNGTLTITGGTIVSIGTTSPEEGFDCDQNTFKITGGTILGIGGGTSTPTSSVCTQRTVIYGGSGSKGTLFSIQGSDQVMSYTIPRAYSQMTLLFSSSKLVSGTTYTIYTGGSVTGGTEFYGLTVGGIYTAGSQVATFTPGSMVTSVGNVSSGGPGGGEVVGIGNENFADEKLLLVYFFC